MSNDKLVTALNKVSEFINSLNCDDEISNLEKFEIFFSIVDEGFLMISGNEALNYRECLKELVAAVESELISPKAIEKLLQRTIIISLDISKKRRDISLKKRIEAAVGELKKSLLADPITFHVYYPVFGLIIDGSPIQVGNVQFCKFDDNQLSSVLNTLSGTESDKKEKNQDKNNIEVIKKADFIDKPVGLVSVKAIDDEAAKIKALKDLAVVIDVINFFSDFIPYQDGYIFLPGNAERCKINVLTIAMKENPQSTFGWETVGPLMPVPLQELLKNDRTRKFGFSKVQSLLPDKGDELENKLIAAIQWAGKASVEERKEEAFLLYAISLESVVLLENDTSELTYRLRTRVAHLLGKNLEERKKISNLVRDLYKIRSKIVHTGYYQVTDADLSLIKLFSQSCILHMLNDEPFTSMGSINDLVQWFTEQVLQ